MQEGGVSDWECELVHAIQDLGNEIARAILPTREVLPLLRAFGSELHADEFDSWPWYRRWWHTPHRASLIRLTRHHPVTYLSTNR